MTQLLAMIIYLVFIMFPVVLFWIVLLLCDNPNLAITAALVFNSVFSVGAFAAFYKIRKYDYLRSGVLK